MTEAMTQRAFVTELARFVESPAWPILREWFKAKCANRVLDSRFAEDRERAWLALQAAGEFMTAIENEVTNNRGLIDGRKTRHETGQARPADGGTAKRSRSGAH